MPLTRSLLLEARRRTHGDIPVGDLALTLLGDPSEAAPVRAAAARLLPGHTVGGGDVADLLAAALQDEDLDLVASAAWAVTRTVSSRAEDLLHPLLDDQRPMLNGQPLGAWIAAQLAEVRTRHDPHHP